MVEVMMLMVLLRKWYITYSPFFLYKNRCVYRLKCFFLSHSEMRVSIICLKFYSNSKKKKKKEFVAVLNDGQSLLVTVDKSCYLQDWLKVKKKVMMPFPLMKAWFQILKDSNLTIYHLLESLRCS